MSRPVESLFFRLTSLQVTAVVIPAQVIDEGLSLRAAEDIDLDGLPIVDLWITNDRFDGQVFSGTLESIAI